MKKVKILQLFVAVLGVLLFNLPIFTTLADAQILTNSNPDTLVQPAPVLPTAVSASNSLNIIISPISQPVERFLNVSVTVNSSSPLAACWYQIDDKDAISLNNCLAGQSFTFTVDLDAPSTFVAPGNHGSLTFYARNDASITSYDATFLRNSGSVPVLPATPTAPTAPEQSH